MRFAVIVFITCVRVPVRMLGNLVYKSKRGLTTEARLEFAVHGITENQTTNTIPAMMSRPGY